MEFATEHALSAFVASCEVTTQKSQKIKNNKACDLLSSDDENDSGHPIFDSFLSTVKYNGIHKMTNSNPNEVQNLSDAFKSFLNSLGRRQW